MFLFRCDRCVIHGIEDDTANDHTTYKESVGTFDHDYCTENPASTKEGHLQLLDYKLMSKEGGRRKTLKEIKAKMTAEDVDLKEMNNLQV